MDAFSTLNDMLRLQQEYGASEIHATAHMYNELRAALSTLRKRSPHLYAVKLSMERLLPEECFYAPTGGRVTMKLRLLSRAPTERASGSQAAQLRAVGVQIDGHTRSATTAEVSLEQQILKEQEAFRLWKEMHPNGTFEEACAAGHRAEAEADRLTNEIREKLQQTKAQDKFAEALRTVGFTGFEDAGEGKERE